jgi:3-phosphoshikimate 1-carboxyvinyltransferase
MKRPMRRLLEPLRQMGADVRGSKDGTAPILVRGRALTGIRVELPVASAQLKSALLLAGLFARGETWIKEPGPARDHTERMLPAFGVEVKRAGPWLGVAGQAQLQSPGDLYVPGDLSSAAFFLIAGLITPGSDLVIENVGVNPTRTGLLDILARMGAEVSLQNEHRLGGEPVADLRVKASRLRGTAISGDLVPRAIDEFPALCVAAAVAEGTTEVRDARELRVKESDRIAAMVRLLRAMGAAVEEREDGLKIEGPAQLRGAAVNAGLDHRIAMAAAVAGLVAAGETVIEGAETIASSFPSFQECMKAVSSS